MTTHRIDRLQEEIQHAVSSILLFEVTDPLIKGVTFTRVMLTKDTSLARIYYEAVGTPKEREKIKEGLDRACPFIRRKLAPILNLRQMPQIEFFYDETNDEVVRVEKLFSRLGA